MGRPYKTVNALLRGETINLDGLYFRMAVDEDGNELPIRNGDLYIAERNTGPKLLIARDVDFVNDWIAPTCDEYFYDINECVRVVEVFYE